VCGISGIWQGSESDSQPLNVVEKMTDALTHRGPDSHGYWSSEDAGIAFGHRRLSIQDLSPAGHQPMHSHSSRYTIVFNGEIYNFNELSARLTSDGHSFNGHSDTEVMLAAIDRWGVKSAVSEFVGMFAFALYDNKQEKLWFGRDRMGEKPLYIAVNDAGLAFSSELKSLMIGLDFCPSINRNSLESYFRYGYFSPLDAPVNRVFKLPPASLLCIDQSDLVNRLPVDALIAKAEKYWFSKPVSRNVGIASKGSDDAEIQNFEEVLVASVRQQAVADVDVGIFLSAGVDSALVAAALQNNSERSIRTYTVAFDDNRYNEAPYAEAIAQQLDTEHTELKLSMDDCLDMVCQLPDLLDEPFADSSFIPSYLISKAAKKHVTVCLSGDGGDELFSGYNRYLQGDRFWAKCNRLPLSVRQTLGKIIRATPVSLIDAVYSPYENIKISAGKKPEKDIGLKAHKIGRLLGAENASLLYSDLLSFWHNSPTSMGEELPHSSLCTNRGAEFDRDFITTAMGCDQNFYLVSDNLFKMDRAAMACSLEVRVPLLDHRVVEYANNLPSHMKVRDGTGKWIMRQLLYRYLPEGLFKRPKMGFSVPLASWLRRELKSWAEELLFRGDLVAATGLDGTVLSSVWVDHQKGRNDYSNAIWCVLMYIVWYERQHFTIAR